MDGAGIIRFVLTNLPAFLLVLAFVIATLSTGIPRTAERYLSWLLLLAVGCEMVWAGFFHVFFPETAASFINWQVSPFQFEIGVADLSIGLVAIASFWRSLEFKSAVVAYVVLFYIGAAIDHVHQAQVAGNFSPGNFGLLLLMTVAKVLLLTGLLWEAWRERERIDR
ncbi:DUF6790 family protein [Hyphomicrobium sp. DMF-1]|uniref:DUF6790 family protein n=1 Tax=Hyphomicrobium sp. DMF-1 TaxID=3019544 RepID=UPI0022EBF6F1|nr:DUF6790 family protein [Hyphomicrobium sp. DMF-1]WBT37744.1 hypothetical protein PE058_19105 [Hyphomicrobium sp. DMF-1]